MPESKFMKPLLSLPPPQPVPKLHIWLSSDQSPRELEAPDEQQTVLNNSREAVPRWDKVSVKYFMCCTISYSYNMLYI